MDRNAAVNTVIFCIMGVALRKESVDRNRACTMTITTCTVVALRKESVDRNANNLNMLCSAVVALRKESVDRNPVAAPCEAPTKQSLSARRAWIEIGKSTTLTRIAWSLSARRAWIEISSQ